MKIGILTFHREINDGSVLQAYCLYCLLKHYFPNDQVELIDYQPKHVLRKRKCLRLSKRSPFLIFEKAKYFKRKSLDDFIKKHMRLSKSLVGSDEYHFAAQSIKQRNYDAIFVGSDTVWDTRPNGGAPKAPNIFFLPEASNVKKISFAASMDKGGPKFVSKDTWETLVSNIETFDYISIRDHATLKYLTDSGISDDRIHYMPDPTLLHDFSGIVMQPNDAVLNSKKIAGVAVSSHALKEASTMQLRKKGYTVVNLLGPTIDGQIGANPKWTYGERLGVYSKLSFMITDRFHGSILTLKQSKAPVMLVEPDYFYPEENSKGRDLFERLGIARMVWRYEANKQISDGLIDAYWKKSLEIDWSDKSAISGLARHTFHQRMEEIKSILANKVRY